MGSLSIFRGELLNFGGVTYPPRFGSLVSAADSLVVETSVIFVCCSQKAHSAISDHEIKV